MEHLRIITTNKTNDIKEYISDYLLSREVFRELGEGIFYDIGDTWIFALNDTACIGFICYNADKIKYSYVQALYRSRGVFGKLYSELPTGIAWSVVASNLSLPIFIKYGFTLIKSYTTCHKLKKIL